MNQITDSTVHHTTSAEIDRARHEAACIVVEYIAGTEWRTQDILLMFGAPDPECDCKCEAAQIAEFVEARITSAEMRAQILRLLMMSLTPESTRVH